MIHNNIIIPLKHPYISPEVTFEEMEGDSMICNSAEAGGGNMNSGDTGGGNVRPPRRAKESIFIFDQDIDDEEVESDDVFAF